MYNDLDFLGGPEPGILLTLCHTDLLYNQYSILLLDLLDRDDVVEGHLGANEQEVVLGADDKLVVMSSVTHHGNHLLAIHCVAEVLQLEGSKQGVAVHHMVDEDVGDDTVESELAGEEAVRSSGGPSNLVVTAIPEGEIPASILKKDSVQTFSQRRLFSF